MEKILDDLMQIKNVKGTLLVGKDGLVIASSGDFQHDSDFIGASISELFSTAETISQERFESGKPLRFFLETASVAYIIYEVTEETLLAIISDSEANFGIISIESDNAIKNLKEFLM